MPDPKVAGTPPPTLTSPFAEMRNLSVVEPLNDALVPTVKVVPVPS